MTATIRRTTVRTYLITETTEIVESGIGHPEGKALVSQYLVECACMSGWWRAWNTAEQAARNAADHDFARHGAHHPRFCNFYGRHDGPCPTETQSLTPSSRDPHPCRRFTMSLSFDEVANEVACETCGWTNAMLCPECPGCGCYNDQCSGWRHEEYMTDDERAELCEQERCEECGADVSLGSYDECVCG
jgi:hypothetical protein